MDLAAPTPPDMLDLGRRLAGLLKDGDVIALIGGLGAGKTLISQGIGEGLGISQNMGSPTFNLVFQYMGTDIALYHFDLYRLEDASQLDDIDFYELSDPGTEGVSLIEWADLFPDAMPDERLEIRIEGSGDEERVLSVSAFGRRAEDLLEEWNALCGEAPK